jgi:hypothetical protein
MTLKRRLEKLEGKKQPAARRLTIKIMGLGKDPENKNWEVRQALIIKGPGDQVGPTMRLDNETEEDFKARIDEIAGQ